VAKEELVLQIQK